MEHLSTDRILDHAFAFWESKVIESAVHYDLFSLLEKKPLNKDEVTSTLSLHPRAVEDFLDSLVSMNLLDRKQGYYSNTEESSVYLVKDSEYYIGGIIELSGKHLYKVWDGLSDLLKTGKVQNDFHDETDFFEAFYKDSKQLKTFAHAVTGLSHEATKHMATKFDWKQYKTFCDLGGAEGGLPVGIAKKHPERTGINLIYHHYKPFQKTI